MNAQVGCNPESTMLKTLYPLPNDYGVYEKREAFSYEYDDRNIYAVVHTMNVSPDVWIYAFSYSKKVEGQGTQGMGTPLKRSREYGSEYECFSMAKAEIRKVINEGKAAKVSSWTKTWKNMDVWAHQLGEQLDLFT